MPPLRGSRRRTAAAPYTTAKGWLSCCRRQTRSSSRKADQHVDDDPLAVLPDDVVSAIFSTVFTDDAVDVTRCAAAFGRWARVVAARTDAIARAMPPPGRYLPHMALGFFHGGKDDDQTRRRQLPQLRFVPMDSASLILGPPPFPGLASISSSSSKPGAKIAGHVLRRLGPAAVVRGVAYWPMNPSVALGVRVDGGTAHHVCYVPYSMKHYYPDDRVLGVTSDGMLAYVSAGVSGDALLIMVEALDLRQMMSVEDGMTMMSSAEESRERWERRQCVRLTQFKISTTTEIKLRWFGDKSGTVIFTVGEGANTSGVFAVNVAHRPSRSWPTASTATRGKTCVATRWTVLGYSPPSSRAFELIAITSNPSQEISIHTTV
ncbi:hypothetical protein PR202_ga10556 [Eleusine coracana subsp. coracana]|uniref:F-box domain-containing protein n=1 Tax=Eleusine coracana subsp. coracana TaxID=191504 RepID=A0AAV5C755_ELECO|nr:hypothetical protein PR202_ga10556 [Eleusine coracana subsp. coracana]